MDIPTMGEKYMRFELVVVDKILRETLLTWLFFGEKKILPPILATLSNTAVNKSGLVIQNPETSAHENPRARTARASS